MSKQRQLYHEQRARALVLLGGKCVDCGSTARLEFDHRVASEKSYEVGDKFGRVRFERIVPELAKCDLRCKACHSKKTVECGERPAGRLTTHGDLAMYTRYGCRCNVCRRRYREWKRAYRVRKGLTTGVYIKPETVEHGMINMYWKGCRCAACKRANADRERSRRHARLAQSAEAPR